MVSATLPSNQHSVQSALPMMWEGHLSICCFHWLINKKMLDLLGQNIGRWSRQNRMLGRKEVRSDAMEPAAKSDMLNLPQ